MRRKEAWELLDASYSESLGKIVLKTIAGLFERSNRDQLKRLMDTLQLRRYSRSSHHSLPPLPPSTKNRSVTSQSNPLIAIKKPPGNPFPNNNPATTAKAPAPPIP